MRLFLCLGNITNTRIYTTLAFKLHPAGTFDVGNPSFGLETIAHQVGLISLSVY